MNVPISRWGKQVFTDVLHLFYPKLCMACEQSLPLKSDLLCVSCSFELPKTNFHFMAQNQLTEQLWGRIPIHHGSAYYYFTKNSGVQNMIHSLKYQNRPDIGEYLGEAHGKSLRESPFYQKIDAIVPVPLHWKKLKKRGYNQALMYAKGLATAFEKPVEELISRTESTSTQTKKSRLHRFQNVEHVFDLVDRFTTASKHFLLVDDVMTTGATLEACAQKILQNQDCKVSVATIAYASR